MNLERIVLGYHETKMVLTKVCAISEHLLCVQKNDPLSEYLMLLKIGVAMGFPNYQNLHNQA